MPRQPRIQYPGAIYHVMARGNRSGPIVLDDSDRSCFVETFAEACEKSAWEVYAWVLMDNHYHLAVRTPAGNLVEGMKWFQNTYTRRFKTRHDQSGALYGDRYKSILVDGEGRPGEPDYLATLIDYIHLNPVRARLVATGDEPGLISYPWSSLASAYAIAPSKRDAWIDVGYGLDLFGFKDSVVGRRKMIARLEARAVEEKTDRCGLGEIEGSSLQSTLRRGWYWGGQEFHERLKKLIPKMKKRTYRSSALGRDAGIVDATEILRKAEKYFELGKGELKKLPRGDVRRAAIGWVIHRRCCTPMGWVAEQLNLRSAANASQQIRRFGTTKPAMLSEELRQWREQMS
ncbi:MAG: putative transposase [Verrucomicrobiales bacterium]|jgi:putative transposase